MKDIANSPRATDASADASGAVAPAFAVDKAKLTRRFTGLKAAA